ncbi:hypothetical protein [Nitrogeniibacter aestuarii]|uniref:hypothetical protein n=1 Tax=Nitrogeniibacter aestuarii TaxID=2815343 RepID=UPI001D0FC42A|nr:hypothetical protein [Nitrogeniibacter aestuarii]
MSSPNEPRLDPLFDYLRFLARRDGLANLTLLVCALWWLALLVIGIGAQWWAPLASLKEVHLWGPWTVDRLLAAGALATALLAVAGPWLMRHSRRPPQLMVLLRDFQSRDVAELAAEYVRRRGAAWGYWVTLENADFRAKESLGGDAEVMDDAAHGGAPPVGGWWGTSLFLGLVLISLFLLGQLDASWLAWLRELARSWGSVGDLVFPIVLIAGICLAWFVAALLIRWLIVSIQRALLLPRRIESADQLELVMETLLERVRRRASTLTLGPLPVISVADAFWQEAVLRCLREARLVVFVLSARESEALDWEFAQVRRLVAPDRTLFIRLAPSGMALSDGAGEPIAVLAEADRIDALDEAVRNMLMPDSPPVQSPESLRP